MATQTLVSDVDEPTFSRLRYYAACVRRLAHRSDIHRIHPSVHDRLHAPLNGGILFCKLQVLRWHQRTDGDILDFLPFVPASLRELVAGGIGTEDRETGAVGADVLYDLVTQFLHLLNENAPSLESLTLSGRVYASTIVRLGELKTLKSLRIINFAHRGFLPLNSPVLQSCAALGLEEFCISLTGGTDNLIAEAFASGFHALRTLRVHGTLALVARLLSRVASRELTTFGVFDPRPDPWRDYRACLTTLAAQFPALRTVSLSGSWSGCPAPLDVLAPLLKLPFLEHLSVVSGTGVALSLAASDAQALAKAWPRLKVLTLLYQPASAGLPLDALSAFAEHCPELRTLALASVDLHVRASAEHKAVAKRSSHALRHIWLPGDTEAAQVNMVAKQLDVMFPHLDLGPFDWPWHPSSDPKIWRKIMDGVKSAKVERRGAVSGTHNIQWCVLQLQRVHRLELTLLA